MMRLSLLLVGVLVLLCPGAAAGGRNPSAKLAMHVVASQVYLNCDDLLPADCESIDCDLSAEELLAEGGWGYIGFLAYDVEGITAVEFAVRGWPTGRAAPVLRGPYWCRERSNTFGQPLGPGGAVGLGSCVGPDSSGLVLLGYVYFGPLKEEDLPITLDFVPSVFTQPKTPMFAVADCSEGYEVDLVIDAVGCRIGGTYPREPKCPGSAGGRSPVRAKLEED